MEENALFFAAALYLFSALLMAWVVFTPGPYYNPVDMQFWKKIFFIVLWPIIIITQAFVNIIFSLLAIYCACKGRHNLATKMLKNTIGH